MASTPCISKKQKHRSAEKMQEGIKKGKICIDCDKFIAHKRPDDYDR